MKGGNPQKIYHGDLSNGNMNGQGKMTYLVQSSNQKLDFYDGFWDANKKCGFGVQVWKNGDRFDGMWQDDNQHGKGSMQYKSGASFVGMFSIGLRDGKGHITEGSVVTHGVW